MLLKVDFLLLNLHSLFLHHYLTCQEESEHVLLPELVAFYDEEDTIFQADPKVLEVEIAYVQHDPRLVRSHNQLLEAPDHLLLKGFFRVSLSEVRAQESHQEVTLDGFLRAL
eukprot:CAMPEP_0170567576 /NCGR_PEP_ID=MMETSP0211-20121228/80567_1 /TAXON_ID=311385 /ORGANISM="Pseudokeronopsis sp., Strain OXSARD2" /LENGTH=111 /DNA_ID=CAMNT_0010889067 /DNA_START=196 /DNA_END=531 /DNA_ORIENTATION=+